VNPLFLIRISAENLFREVKATLFSMQHLSKQTFEGFSKPEANFFRLPNEWTDITAGIDNIAELKVVQYILRHTWGYQEYSIKKHITIDEFIR
jgi:hypothetical protein